MRKARLLLLSVVAMAAVGAIGTVGAAPAFAGQCVKEEAAKFALCITSLGGSGLLELIERTVGFLDFKETKTASELEVSPLGSKVECFNATSTGVLEPTGNTVLVMNLTITFENGCHVKGLEATCKVTETITTMPIDGTPTLINGTLNVDFVPETGTLFSTVHITGGECEQAATVKVEGLVLCEIKEAEEDKIEQLLECPLKQPGLKNGEKEAGFLLSELIDLHAPYENDQWSIIQGT